MIDWEKRYYRIHNIGLIFDCPYGFEVDTCPFQSLRDNKDINQRYLLWKGMPENQKEMIMSQHRKCVNTRLK